MDIQSLSYIHKDVFLEIQFNNSNNSTPEPRNYSQLIKLESLYDRSTVHIGNPNIEVVNWILIILGISLCVMYLHFMYKCHKQNKLMEAKKRADETLPLPQVLL